MKKILFIAYFFPPMGGSGVQRSIKFVKYLPDYDIQPIVLTVDSRLTRWPKDSTFLKELSKNTIIYKAPTLDVNWIFKLFWGLRLHKIVTWLQLNWLIPDAEITWLPFAKRMINKIVAQHTIDAVYITGGPFSSMLLGPYVKQKHNLEYIIDFRDEWTNNHTRHDQNYPLTSRNRDNNYESKVVQDCKAIIYTHPRFMQDSFEKKYPFLRDRLSQIITNGYDESDFSPNTGSESTQSKKFTLVYPGSFYDRRNPAIILKAIKELIKSGEISPDQISLEIYGKNSPGFVLGGYADDQDIKKIVKFHPYCTHKESIEVMHRADALLLFLAPGPNSEPEIPGKLFEYLRSYRPIFAVVPSKGTAAELVISSNTGFVYDSDNFNDVLAGFSKMISQWKKGEFLIKPDRDYIKHYERKYLTGLLAELIHKVVV